MELPLMGISTAVASLGVLLGLFAYVKIPKTMEAIAKIFSIPITLLREKYYMDEIYEILFLSPIRFIASRISLFFVDTVMIEGFLNGSVILTRYTASQFRKLQTGRVGNYLAYMLFGVLLLVYLIFFETRNF
jgi:NADH-quinone oxidoreductase subunit L